MYITERHANIVYVFLNGTFVVIRHTQTCVSKTSSKVEFKYSYFCIYW